MKDKQINPYKRKKIKSRRRKREILKKEKNKKVSIIKRE